MEPYTQLQLFRFGLTFGSLHPELYELVMKLPLKDIGRLVNTIYDVHIYKNMPLYELDRIVEKMMTKFNDGDNDDC